MSHWSINQISQAQNVTFTESLPFLLLAAALGGLSANIGLFLVLGYALGDFLLAGPRLALPGELARQQLAFLPANPLVNTLLLLRIPELFTYVLLFLLVVQPTLFTRYTIVHLRSGFLRLKQRSRRFSVLVEALSGGLVQGTMVYLWTLSTPAIIRIPWSWLGLPPPLSAVYYLQTSGLWVALAAGGATAGRALTAASLLQVPGVAQLAKSQGQEIEQADEHPSWPRRLPALAGVLLTAGITTLLLSGLMTTFSAGLLFFGSSAVILLVRRVLLPYLPFWDAWVRYLSAVPVLLRLLYGSVITYLLTRFVLSYYPPDTLAPGFISATLLPVWVGTCISLLVIALFVPCARQKTRSATSGQAL